MTKHMQTIIRLPNVIGWKGVARFSLIVVPAVKLYTACFINALNYQLICRECTAVSP